MLGNNKISINNWLLMTEINTASSMNSSELGDNSLILKGSKNVLFATTWRLPSLSNAYRRLCPWSKIAGEWSWLLISKCQGYEYVELHLHPPLVCFTGMVLWHGDFIFTSMYVTLKHRKSFACLSSLPYSYSFNGLITLNT